MASIDLILLLLVLKCAWPTDSQLTKDGHTKNHQPPPNEHLIQDRRCVGGDYYANHSFFNCHGARFIASNGYFQPCNRHNHCYDSREPSDWCLLSPHQKWTNWGCHCDYKLGSCVIERYDHKHRQLQWAYCNPKREFYCATRFDAFRERHH